MLGQERQFSGALDDLEDLGRSFFCFANVRTKCGSVGGGKRTKHIDKHTDERPIIAGVFVIWPLGIELSSS